MWIPPPPPPRDPLSSIVASVLLHLGGVLPPHVAFSPSHHTVTHDWRWAVGAHSQSATCHTEGQLSAFQRDAFVRSFVVTGLEESVADVNEGIRMLGGEKSRILGEGRKG